MIRVRTLLVCVLATIFLFAVSLAAFPDPQGIDFYCSAQCSLELIRSGAPYDPSFDRFLGATWDVAVKSKTEVAPVCAYPLPYYILLLPFALVTHPWGLIAWFSIGAAIPVLIARRFGWRWEAILIPIMYYPLAHAMVLKTSTVAWTAAVCLLWISLTIRRSGWLAGLMIAILPAKPQVGALFAVVGAIELIRDYGAARSARYFIPALLLWSAAFLFDPNWIGEWIAAVSRYRGQAASGMAFPLLVSVPCIIASLFFGGWRIIWPVTAAAQVILFPVNDLYCALPLLVLLTSLPTPYGLAASAASWLIPISFSAPNNLGAFLACLVLPALAASVLGGWRRARSGAD